MYVPYIIFFLAVAIYISVHKRIPVTLIYLLSLK